MKTDEINIPSPCDEDWNAMAHAASDAGALLTAAKRRFCQACSFHVVDLSSLTEAEARTAMAGPRDSRLCVSYIVRTDGTIRFQDAVPHSVASDRAGLRGASTWSEAGGETPRLQRGATVQSPVPGAGLVQIRRPMRRATLALALAACAPHGDAKEQPEVDAVETAPQARVPAYVVPSESGTGAVETLEREHLMNNEIRVKGDIAEPLPPPPPPEEHRLQGKPSFNPPVEPALVQAPCDEVPAGLVQEVLKHDENRKKGKLTEVDSDLDSY